MIATSRYTIEEILSRARMTFAPLSCEPIWSRDRDRLGFLIRDETARRGLRFAPLGLEMLKDGHQLDRVLRGMRAEVLKKGLALPD